MSDLRMNKTFIKIYFFLLLLINVCSLIELDADLSMYSEPYRSAKLMPFNNKGWLEKGNK